MLNEIDRTELLLFYMTCLLAWPLLRRRTSTFCTSTERSQAIIQKQEPFEVVR